MDTSQDTEIADFQDEVRNLVIKLSGAPGSQIDGAGSDAGWQEFTLAEIAQGFAYVSECHQRELEALRGECDIYRATSRKAEYHIEVCHTALQKAKVALEVASTWTFYQKDLSVEHEGHITGRQIKAMHDALSAISEVDKSG